MSLTNMIQYEDDWKNFFKGNIPKKADFKTLSGHFAFSNDYEEQVEYKLSNSHYSSVVGTAFDYLARWIVARHGEIEYIDVSKEKYQNLIDSFEQILGKEEYQNYLEEEKKCKEQKKREQEKREKEEQKRLKKEQRELEEIIKRGNKDEITLYKMKKILGFGDYFDEKVNQCKNEKQVRRANPVSKIYHKLV